MTARPVTVPRLSDAHRKWLNVPERRALKTVDFTCDFIKVFALDPHDAGWLLAEWAKEEYERV